MKVKEFNIVIVGTGGQGQITLLQILAESARAEGYDFKTSELHGLSQRGGSVEVQVRFGKEIFSPLIPQGKGDLVIALELQEALKGFYFANNDTIFLVNDYFIPIPGLDFSREKTIDVLNKLNEKLVLVEASKICKEKLGNEILAGVYLLGVASYKKLWPLKPETLVDVVKKTIPEKYLELNLKTLDLAKTDSTA